MACGSCGGRKSKARTAAAYSPESIPDPLAGPDGVYRFTDDAGDCERYHGIFTGTTVFVLGLGTEHERIFLRTTKAAAERYAAEHQLSWQHLQVTDLCHDRVVGLLGA